MTKDKKHYPESYLIAPKPVSILYIGDFKAEVIFSSGEKLMLDFCKLHERVKRGPWTEPLFSEEDCSKVSLNENGDVIFPNTTFDILWSYVYDMCMESV